MKKIFLFIGFLTLSFFTANAQEISDNAIGLRLGDNDGFGAEISYQRRLSDNNRLELDLGLRNGSGYDGFKATALYQWVWQLENRFNWFAGAGGGLGHWNAKNLDVSETYVFVSGVIGIEYSFDIPLMISLDYRPDIGFGDYYKDFNSDFGLGIRYQF
ncbi:hypothetical protein CSC81_08110 [Tenacibaculum discolor]|uniref:Outer membrane insertion C-signal n=1 Tax=Tenacibaculum discolor TaxID=361581 RepID=A0A2G1BU09_9FLAO|nr:hypothetical protein [Tenacibaculum discolor]MDP2542047.1 hypothetical protein [Tenacibaculum discolor]PHN97541.1 hypothetical protein CSC81_08110 [Tenacibaculum discolor]